MKFDRKYCRKLFNPMNGHRRIMIMRASYRSSDREPIRKLFRLPFEFGCWLYNFGDSTFKSEVIEEMSKFVDLRAKRIDDSDDLTSRVVMVAARSKQDGSYVGNLISTYKLLCRGIDEFYSLKNGTCACTGFDSTNRIWYGWSHRAMMGFRIGQQLSWGTLNLIKDEDDEEYKKIEELADRNGFTILNLKQARTCAKLFAEAVG